MKTGRPPMYATAEELDKAIDNYFDNLPEDEEPSIVGLTLSLGFVDRRSLYDYEKKPEFTHSIKRAISKVEKFIEEGAITGKINPTFAIFWLKNRGWKDKTETDVNVNNYNLFEKSVEAKAEKYAVDGNGKEETKD